MPRNPFAALMRNINGKNQAWSYFQLKAFCSAFFFGFANDILTLDKQDPFGNLWFLCEIAKLNYLAGFLFVVNTLEVTDILGWLFINKFTKNKHSHEKANKNLLTLWIFFASKPEEKSLKIKLNLTAV